MEPLRTLVCAGLRRDKGTFIGLAVLLFLAGAALTFTIGLFVDLSQGAHERYDEAGCGDLLVSEQAATPDPETTERIAALPEVERVRETPAFSVPVQFENSDGTPKSESQSVTTCFEAWGTGISANLFTDSLDAYDDASTAPAPNSVYVTPSARVLHGVEVGDTAMLNFGGEERRLTVGGFFEDPQLGTPFMEVKRFLVAQDTFDELYDLAEAVRAETPRAVTGASLSVIREAYPLVEYDIFLTPEARTSESTSQGLAGVIQERAGWGTNETTMFSRETLVGYALMVVQILSAILAMFALLIFTVALVMCVHSVSAAIEEGYADWGITKAVGISPQTLRRTLVSQYALVALIALGLGLVIGMIAEPFVWPAFLLVTGVLVDTPAFPVPALACLGALFAVLMVTVVLKVRKLGRITPLAALRQGAEDVRFSPRANCAIRGRHLEASLAWRALISKKHRYVGMGVCSLLLCAFITLCFGIGGAVSENDAVYRAFGIWKSDVSAALVADDVTLDDVRTAIEEVAPIRQEWIEGAAILNLDDEARTFVGLSEEGVLSGTSIATGRFPRLDNEVAVGINFARSLQVGIGDEVVVTDPAGDEKTLIVSGTISSVLNGGNGALLTIDGLKWLTGNDAGSIDGTRQYRLEDDADIDAVLAHLEQRFGDDVNLEETGLFGSATNMILLVRNLLVAIGYSMTAFAALLACVAVALVSRRMLLSERRDLGIYRALGLRVRTLRQSFALRFLGVALIGSVLGAALVMALGSQLIGSLFGLFGAGAFAIVLPWWLAALLSAGLAAVFALSAYAFSRSIRTISVRELVTE